MLCKQYSQKLKLYTFVSKITKYNSIFCIIIYFKFFMIFQILYYIIYFYVNVIMKYLNITILIFLVYCSSTIATKTNKQRKFASKPHNVCLIHHNSIKILPSTHDLTLTNYYLLYLYLRLKQ